MMNETDPEFAPMEIEAVLFLYLQMEHNFAEWENEAAEK